MPTLYVPDENDVRRWIKEAVTEFLNENLVKNVPAVPDEKDELLGRKEMAGLLGISLVTLHDWINRGLPCHKQRGRLYFIRSEVIEYVRGNPRMAKVLPKAA